MSTNDTHDQIQFQDLGRRRIEAAFDAGRTTTDGGVLLLREVAERTGIFDRLARCFTDHRNPDLIEHTVRDLVTQRAMAIACGYEDLNDHDALRDDPLFATAVGKTDPEGKNRRREQDQGHGLAGRSTLNRLELTPDDATAQARYKKIVCNGGDIDRLFVDLFLDAHDKPPRRIVLDLDATDDPLHGNQEGRFFHGYYRCYCYLPLYIFCGDFLLCARLRRSNIDGSAGAKEEVERIVEQIREHWPKVRITLRGDSGFARDTLMTWCEANRVDFVFGLAKNSRLKGMIADDLAEVRRQYDETERSAKRYSEFPYRTLDSWNRTRRVIAKAEYLPGKANPRFVVTSLKGSTAKKLYEKVYCARGDMENRIKEQQLDMFADRTSCATMRANQLRLYFASIAYVLVNDLRRLGLAGTRMASTQCGTIRVRLLKIAGIVRCSVRRIRVAFSSVFPAQDVFRTALANLAALSTR